MSEYKVSYVMIFIYAILFGAFFVVGYKMGKSSYTEKTVESYVDIPRVTVKPTIPEPISEKKSEKPCWQYWG